MIQGLKTQLLRGVPDLKGPFRSTAIGKLAILEKIAQSSRFIDVLVLVLVMDTRGWHPWRLLDGRGRGDDGRPQTAQAARRHW